MLRYLPIAATVTALVAPSLIGPYYTMLLLPAFGYGIALLGLNILFGYTGLLSIGHALFLAIGSYTAGYMTSMAGILHVELIILAAIAVGTAVGVPVGLICVRYTKIYFGILTLAFSMLFYSFLIKFYHLTGGDEGIQVFRPYLFGLEFTEMDKIQYLTGPFYYYLVGLLILACFVMRRIVTSPFGLRLRSIRDNPQKAEYLGVQVRRYRFYAFLISAVYGAVAGVVLSVPTGLAEPGQAYWLQSGNVIFMLLLGGYTNFFGPVAGAFFFLFLQDFVLSVTEHWRFVFGALLIVLVLFLPRGIMGQIDRRERWET